MPRKKENDNEYMKTYNQRPKVRERRLRYNEEYYSRPEVKIYQSSSVYKIRRKEYREKYKTETRNRFLDMYGRKCACCGETNVLFLTLDHVQNTVNSVKQKKHSGIGGSEYRRAIKEHRPDIYQILCFNCNCGKNKNKGICPHIKIETREVKYIGMKKYVEKLKLKFFELYGRRCNKCGLSNPWFLTLDHVKDNGRENGKRKPGYIELLRATREYAPQEYQILCFNCNCTKHRVI
jgi:hypothetical protein